MAHNHMSTMPLNTAVLRDDAPSGPQWLLFRDPYLVIAAMRVEQVMPSLQRVEALVARGAYAVGFVSYEAAPALDSSFQTVHAARDFPLLWFGMYEPPERICAPSPENSYALKPW